MSTRLVTVPGLTAIEIPAVIDAATAAELAVEDIDKALLATLVDTTAGDLERCLEVDVDGTPYVVFFNTDLEVVEVGLA